MTTLTQRLRLKKHTTADGFLIQDYTDNWNMLDSSPGLFVCTSITRPTGWGSSHNGRKIIETDTGLEWWFDGTAFKRSYPSGHLGAISSTDPVISSATTLQTALTLNVTVPDGDRSVMVNLAGPGVYNTVGLARLAIFRGATQIQSWLSQGELGSLATEQPRHISMALLDFPAKGAQTYTLRYSSEPGYGGTTTLQGAVSTPLTLSVLEV